MAGYLVACVKWHDTQAADRYGKVVVESLRPFGGRYLVRGAPVAKLEGEEPPERLAIIEFPTAQAVSDWHASEQYAEARKIRDEYAQTHWLVAMDQVTM